MLNCPRSMDCNRFLRFRRLANGELPRILNGMSLRSQHQLRFCSHSAVLAIAFTGHAKAWIPAPASSIQSVPKGVAVRRHEGTHIPIL